MSEKHRAILAGLCLAWLLGFLRPTLFNDQRTMAFPEYVPRAATVGSDLSWALDASRRITPQRPSPYLPEERLAISYPPAGMLALRSLGLVGNDLAYAAVSLGTLASFAFLVLVLPPLLGSDAAEIRWLVFAAGLFSYGLHFELERGAFNLIATALALGGAVLHRSSTSRLGRLAGCLVFSLGCHLKIYPLVYGLVFVRSFREWSRNLRLLGLLLAINVALLFVLGTGALRGFFLSISQQALRPYVWEGNLSAASFAAWSGLPAPVTIGVLLACGLLALGEAFRAGRAGEDPFVFAVATGLALVLPGTSHDYKLPLLAPAAVLVLTAVARSSRCPRTAVLLAFGLSLTYHMTLFSYTNRRPLLENAAALVVLFAVLSGAAAMTLGRREGGQESPP